MDWTPISQYDIREIMNADEAQMTSIQRNIWKEISIIPEKWVQEPWGTAGGGFWAVGLIGATVIYYNDIEEGFNTSRYTTYGVIDEYWCNQDDLSQVVAVLERKFESNFQNVKLGPPRGLP